MKKQKQLFFYVVLFSWTAIIVVSYLWNINTTKKNTVGLVTTQSAAFFEEIETTRLWNAKHGGVYVKITDKTQPNEYLDVPNRELFIDSLGVALTKVNPAFMTRQIAELAKTNSKIQYHITSLKPIRPANKATEWEAKALGNFKKPTDYTLEFIENDSISVYRYMAPLFVKKGCLKCHEKQGYKEGDIRGGISVTTPAVAFLEAESLQKFNILVFHIISLLVGLVSLILFKNYSQKNYNILTNKNSELEQQKEEINVQAERLLESNTELYEKNEYINFQSEQIKSSIKYAYTIQEAILPSKKIIDRAFENFILFKPKDVVSGDFYWFKQIFNESKEVEANFIAVADCTGHGVSGAFMSMIGTSLLSEIVTERKIYFPSEILSLLDENIRISLKQEEKKGTDGMDVCLCKLEKLEADRTKVTFAGAKRLLIYFDKNKNEIKYIKGDKNSIAGAGLRTKSGKVEFTDNEIILNKGDILYLSSDGFVDQNNSERKKYGMTKFLKLLKNISDKEMSEQNQILETEYKNHKGQEEQRDDIAVIGIRL